ncbi:hypothetical protein BM221_009679 [Beauveria bassiana]|uniref:Uncharacterized protein n=1 Tax=Beauveria bassiana TaxID=176275 RepID=A0A2N6NAJ4_BEABA|nr:hypothetical protein BM221_009679 [Beauveria bassiana]
MHYAKLNYTAVSVLTIRRALLDASYAKLLGTTATRCASTSATKPPCQQSEGGSRPFDRLDRHQKLAKAPQQSFVSRVLSADVAKFMNPRNGHLTTTPAFVRFFRENPTVEHDHGVMARFDASAQVRRLDKAYGARLAWSPRHVLHPHRLRFLDPHGHPLAPKIRSDHAKKTREQALWAFATSVGGVSAVVWQLTKRELLRAVFCSLAARGYDKHGRKEDGTELHGTLWLTVWRPQHARRASAEAFGEVVADTLDKHYATRPEERRRAAAMVNGGDAKGQSTANGGSGDDGERSSANETKQWQPRLRYDRDRPSQRPAADKSVPSTWQPRNRS